MSETDLQRWMAAFRGHRIGVVGDFMLDRYIWGRASRISQEAPVPVVHVQRESYSLGGAANVARNIVSLGAEACTFGVIGNDSYGETLEDLLAETGIDTGGVLRSEDRCTIVKTRVIAGTQQVVRIDREQTDDLPQPLRRSLFTRIEQAVERRAFDALIIEDYAKGMLTRALVRDLVSICSRRGIPVALDPHAANAFDVPGLRLLTPNRAEAFALCGCYYRPGTLPLSADEPLLEVGRRLRERWHPELLLITLGALGMALFEGDGDVFHIPTTAREVFDVSGAGDTVMATFMVALLAGAPPRSAAALANHAAGIVVAEVGTAAVTLEELERHILESPTQ